jgi:3-oxoacyl-[acyl-carrier-protein] synthase-3
MKDAQGHEHWMLYEGAPNAAFKAPYSSRFESLGLALPAKTITSKELLETARHRPHIDLERLTGIEERRVCVEGEDSFTLALAAAQDCLAHSAYKATDIDLILNCSISKNKGGLRHQLEPAFAVAVRKALGATQAQCFDVSNACAGMLTGVFILNDFIRRGAIRRGMVVSGECISNLGVNASQEIWSILSPQLASLTLGDAGVAAIVDRAAPEQPGFTLMGFTTVARHSRLCIGVPSRVGPGAQMYTKARALQRVAIEDAPALLRDVLGEVELRFDDVDWLIPHQTSARAIEKGTREIASQLGAAPKNVLINVARRGNTASTTHFVALYEYLASGKIKQGERVMLVSFASGLQIGVLIFQMDELANRYGNHH